MEEEEEVGVGVWRCCQVEVNPGAENRGRSNMSPLMRRRRRRGEEEEEEEEEEKKRSMLGSWRRRSKRRRQHNMRSGRDGCSS